MKAVPPPGIDWSSLTVAVMLPPFAAVLVPTFTGATRRHIRYGWRHTIGEPPNVLAASAALD